MSSPTTTELQISGMTCNNCARHVTEAIQGVSNVRSAAVSLERKRATVQWTSAGVKSVPAVLAAVALAGYEAEELSPAAAESPQSRWQWNLIVGLGVTALLMIGEWGFGLALTSWFQWLAFVLAGIVQIFCGAEFYTGAWRQLKVGQSNMDTLVALGSTTAFGYSTWALLGGMGGHVYFMEAAAIISLVSFGHWLEARVSEKAGGALKSLLNLAPQTARKIITNGSAPESHPHSETASPFPTGAGEGARVSHPLNHFVQTQPLNLRNLKFEAGQNGLASAVASEVEVPVAELKISDRVALRPGDHVPVDGVVLEGESAVDEAMLTGEAIPVDKKSGSELFAGTVNLNGRLIMRVTATGEETALAHIVATVQRAQTSRAEIQRLGDRISNVFVPVIIAVALAAGLWWGLAPDSANRVHECLAQFFWHIHGPAHVAAGFIIAAAVLIVACPCAMGLATPAAIMASANAAARRGILVRDGVALEKAGTITAVIFDKTGTLTSGRPEVMEIWQNSAGVPPAPLALVLARHSTHPLSRAVAMYCEKTAGSQSGTGVSPVRFEQTVMYSEKSVGSQPPADVTTSDWREIRGSGVEAKSVIGNLPSAIGRLGSLRWLRESGVDLAAGEKFVAEWSGQGASVVGLAAEKELLALFAVRDALKPHSAAVVSQLQQQNLKTYLLTGDNSPTAAAIAKQIGITSENVFAEVRPEQKAEFVKKLQAQGERVAFVGDGINDAPALTQADLGIAVSRASDVAREAADIILLKSEIEAVPEALGLARATLRTIKQNLFWAFFYNALGVPLAALGFISPVFCAVAMGLSDLIVIGNALRLLRWRQ